MKNYGLFFVMCVALTSASLVALDVQTPYRATLFNVAPLPVMEPWATTIEARASTGKARKAFSRGGQRTGLFNAYGPFNIAQLGIGLEELNNAVTFPRTNAYWGANGVFVTSANNNPANYPLGPTDGDVEFNGRFKTTECDISLQQNVMWGFYVHAYLPIKDYTIDSIGFKNVGPAVIPSIGNPVNPVNMNEFLTLPNNLPAILKENGISIPLTQTFKKSGIGDLVLSAGWQGATDQLEGMITSISGLMQIGALLPTAARRNEDQIFAIPLGYNNFIGVQARATGEIGLWRFVSVGGQVGTLIFLSNDRDMRMQSDIKKNQNGWIALEKGHTNVDPGSIWDFGAYAKVDGFLDGFAIIAGYSYVRQERTHLHVKDSNFLKTVIAAQAALVPNPNFYSQDDVVNSDLRLRGWETHNLNFVVQYQPCTKISPIIRLEYAVPVAGKVSWVTDVFAGTAGLTVEWDF